MDSLNPIAAAAGGATPSSFNSSKVSRWSDLSYDLVVCILSRLSSVDLIVGVSSVCSSWRAAARDRRCWRILDLSDWDSVSSRVVDTVSFNQVLNRVLGFVRECDFIEEVYLPPVADEQDLCLVSERLPKLLYLSFPRSEIPELTAYFALTEFESLKGIQVHNRFFLKAEMILISSLRFPEVFELKLLCENPLGNYIVLFFEAIPEVGYYCYFLFCSLIIVSIIIWGYLIFNVWNPILTKCTVDVLIKRVFSI